MLGFSVGGESCGSLLLGQVRDGRSRSGIQDAEFAVITPDEMKVIMPHAGGRVEIFHEPLNDAMREFEINSTPRQAAFLAQIAHESGSLRYVSELASGDAYEGRADLGNDEPGDGRKYKGHGLIQITGKLNHFLCADALGFPRDEIIAYLQTPVGAARSAAWFWVVGAGLNLSKAALRRCGYGCNLNDIADKGDFVAITYAINGGTNGLKDRIAYYERAQRVLA